MSNNGAENGTTDSDIGDDGRQASEDEGYEGDGPRRTAALSLVDHAADLHYVPGWAFDLSQLLERDALGRHRLRGTGSYDAYY